MFCACLLSQLCLTLCDPTDCSPPGSSVHGILRARILEWVAMPSARGSSQPRDRTQVSYIAGGFFTIWATREALVNLSISASKNIICGLEIVHKHVLASLSSGCLCLQKETHKHTHLFLKVVRDTPRRRQWHCTPVLSPGKCHGWRSLVGYSPWGH